MKAKIYFGIILAALSCLVGCNGKVGPETPGGGLVEGSVVGTWHMQKWSETSAADVYVEFAEGGTFNLYQRVYSPYYEYRKGTWKLDGGVISGKYESGTPWTASYKALFNKEGNVMTLTRTDNDSDVATYTKKPIPEEVIKESIPSKAVPGDDSFRFL